MTSKVNVILDHLPSSIEAYLEEAGFTGTEIIILKKLLEEDALTLREIAAKTGKSTGVLDQAMKKLVKKGIVTKESINDTAKFVLNSLTRVLTWMEEDMRTRREQMERKHQNFASFITSMEQAKRRPEMEHFEGEEGLMQAYRKLLDTGTREMLRYFPVRMKEEDDPLRAFRVQYFRARRKREIFSRVISHDTPLGRRYQSRDAFEYRQTLLVPEEECPFTFEKVIAGDTVACIDLENRAATLMRFPELADSEISVFEALWRQGTASAADRQASSTPSAPPPEPRKPHIPRRTETLSHIREFFLSGRSLVTVAVLGLLAAGLTGLLYRHNVALNTERVRERAKSIAATGALQFEAEDLNALRTADDITKPEYAKVIYQLNEIRRQNEGVTYIYLMRPTDDPSSLEFVADADSLDPYVKKDLNNDGTIDDADALSPPGERFDATEYPKSLLAVTEKRPTADDYPVTDQWGTWISGNGPVINSSGTLVAILGVDIDANRVQELTRSAFTPLYWFLGFFLLFLLIRLAAFNRPLLHELTTFIRRPSVAITTLGAAFLSLLITAGLYFHQTRQTIERLRERAVSIAATAALQFDASDVEQLRTAEDINRPEYRDVVLKLAHIQQQNPLVMYVYLLRPTEQPERFAFIAASDALDPLASKDSSGDGVLDEADEIVVPGDPYDVSAMDALMNRAYSTPAANTSPYTDQWGTFLSAYAPVKDGQGNVAAVLAVDIEAKHIHRITLATFTPVYVFLGFFLLFLLFRTPSFSSSLCHRLLLLLRNRTVLLSILFVAVGIVAAKVHLHHYTVRIQQEEIGRRLMAIAVTAAPTINPDDLNVLRKAGDMRKEEYQRVFKQLNDIRQRNPDITYAYILRPTDMGEGIWEFVVDADSNYFLPQFFMDLDNDGELTEADENVWPGFIYPLQTTSPRMAINGLKGSMYEFQLVADQWGRFITGSAPIVNESGKAIAILGLDMELRILP